MKLIIATLTGGVIWGMHLLKLFYSKTIDNRTKLTIYQAVVRSTLTYQIATIQSADIEKLATLDRSLLRRIVKGYVEPSEKKPYWSICSNEELIERREITSFEDKIKITRLSWAGHVARMDKNEESRRVMEEDVAGLTAKYRRGRMKKRRVETIIEDMELESQYGTSKEAQKRENVLIAKSIAKLHEKRA